MGFDAHRLVAGRVLVLGGVEIPHDRGLEGHSDGDALLHALTDAVLGAVGAPDIGSLFPAADPRWKNASSRIFLEKARKGPDPEIDPEDEAARRAEEMAMAY